MLNHGDFRRMLTEIFDQAGKMEAHAFMVANRRPTALPRSTKYDEREP